MRHFRTLLDLSSDELERILIRADELKTLRGTDAHPRPLLGQTVAIVLEKASTRTRLSFEVGIGELGGTATTLMGEHTQLRRGEPLSDTAHMLSGFVHGVVYRTFGHDRIEELCKVSRIPVVNGLSESYHPCQLLADLQTVRGAFGKLEDLKVAWVGDGNNMAHSWMNAAARSGFELRVATPSEYGPDETVVEKARSLGATIMLSDSPAEAVDGADVVTTDVWASMGHEQEQQARMEAFKGFIVDAALMSKAKPEAIFLHCLPAHRGEEVSAEVLEGSQSRVWIEAENRLHSQKALLELLFASANGGSKA